MISAKGKRVVIEGTTYEIGMSLTMIFQKIYTEYGLEVGQRLIDEAQNLALKS